jgi:allantoate deiminase
VAGTLDEDMLDRTDAGGTRVRDAIRGYGLDPDDVPGARAPDGAVGYLEVHIEQGPVLDRLGVPLGVVEMIAGQTRLEMTFTGAAGHAGTTPMTARRDALAGAAEWIVRVEAQARSTPGLVATVGRVEASPGATNVIPERCSATLDVRHPDDAVRGDAVRRLVDDAHAISARRGLDVRWAVMLDQAAVAMDPRLAAALERAAARGGTPVHRLASGAGHDAMVLAARMPASMLFVRSPGGTSHHPDETVQPADVAAALETGRQFVEELVRSHA